MVVSSDSGQTALPLGDSIPTRPLTSPYVSKTKAAVLRFILPKSKWKGAMACLRHKTAGRDGRVPGT